MSSKHKKSTLRTRIVGFKNPQKIIVFVEGRNTELSYIDLLKKSNLSVVPVVKRGHGIGSCVEFVNDSNKAYNSLPSKTRNKYTQKWLMFDYDGHDDFSKAIKEARTLGFEIAFSSMCIEYWFLLHFQNHDGDSIPCKNNSHSYAQIEILNKHIKKYNSALDANKPRVKLYDSGSKNVEEDLFELMLAIDPVTRNRRIEDACTRSCNIHRGKCQNGAEFEESVTTMYQFLKTIGFVKQDRNGNFVLAE